MKALLTIIFCSIAAVAAAQTFTRPFVESKSDAAALVMIESVEIQRGKTAVVLRVDNTSAEPLSFKFYGAENYRAMYVEDATTHKKYKPIWTLFGFQQPREDANAVVMPHASKSYTLYFEKLDAGTNDINILEPVGDRGDWDFYGVKLMSKEELAAWKTQKETAERNERDAKAAEQARQAQEKYAKDKTRQLENQRQQEQVQKDAEANEKRIAREAIARTKAQTTTDISFDGVYAPNGKAYVRLKSAPMRYGRFGYLIGSVSDFNKFQAHFLPTEPEYVILSSDHPRLILTGSDAADATQFRVSDVENIFESRRIVARDVRSDELFSSSPIYIAAINDNLTYTIYTLKKKTISKTRVELMVDATLDKDKSYTLWCQRTGKYYFFKVR